MNVFFYTRNGTFLHRIDPRMKLVALAVVFLSIAIVKSVIALACVFMALALLIVAAKSARNIAKMAGMFCTIAIVTFCLWLVFYTGPQSGRMAFAVAMSMRFVDFLLAGLLFLSITSLEEFSHGLMLLGMPYPMAFSMSLSFRLVIVFVSTGFTIVEAQKVRGNDAARGPIWKRIAAYTPLLAPLILSGVKRAETLTLALESKGFSPHNKINLRGRYRMKPPDWIVLVLTLAAAGAVVIFALGGLP